MKTSRLLMSGLLLAGLLQSPAILFGQTKQDIVSIQRDISQLEMKLADLKTNQTARMDSLDAQLRQVLESNLKMHDSLVALQKNLSDTLGAISSLNEQQGKQLLAPMATVSSRVDTMSTEFSELKQSVNALGQQIQKLDSKLNELKSTVSALSTPAPAPPPPAGGAAANGAPPGFSASAMFGNAMNDYYGGKYELALDEFKTFLMYAANTENGPTAYYTMGKIYFNGAQYDDAAKAFDAVLERYQENPSSPDALFMKAQSLMKAGRHPEAITELKTFIGKYPSDPNKSKAQLYLNELNAPPKQSPGRGKKGK